MSRRREERTGVVFSVSVLRDRRTREVGETALPRSPVSRILNKSHRCDFRPLTFKDDIATSDTVHRHELSINSHRLLPLRSLLDAAAHGISIKLLAHVDATLFAESAAPGDDIARNDSLVNARRNAREVNK